MPQGWIGVIRVGDWTKEFLPLTMVTMYNGRHNQCHEDLNPPGNALTIPGDMQSVGHHGQESQF